MMKRLLDFLQTAYYIAEEKYNDIKWYFRNIIRFSRVLSKWRPYDYAFSLEMFAFSLDQLADNIHNGEEEEISREKKVHAIYELTEELRRDYESEITFNAGDDIKEYGRRLSETRARHYDKIFRLIRGQADSELLCNDDTPENYYEEFIKKFDGSGIETWWN